MHRKFFPKPVPHLPIKKSLFLIICGIFLGLTIYSISRPPKEILEPIPTQVGTIHENQTFSLDNALQSSADLKIDLKNFHSPKEYISEIKNPNFDFSALVVEWKQKKPKSTDIRFFIRFLENDTWSDYMMVHADIDGPLNIENDDQKKAFFALNLAQAFQYTIILSSEDKSQTPMISDLTFTYLRSKTPVANSGNFSFSSELFSSLKVFSSEKPRVIKRTSWGADESLRVYSGDKNPLEMMLENEKDFREQFKDEIITVKTVEKNDAGELLTWPIEYPQSLKKIVIHHTATLRDLDNPAEAIRNIYYYHTKSRGFGDIGYNFVIDSKGRIYEGRAGGENAVGAHAAKFNHGSIGIAILGDYTSTQPSYETLRSLLNLINYLGKKYQINPYKSSLFRGEMLPNILGHRDVGETSCPGNLVYEKIPIVRRMLSGGFESGSINTEKDKSFIFEEISIRNILNLKPQEIATVKLILKNIGSETWDQNTYLLVNRNPANEGYLEIQSDPKNSLNKGKLIEKEVPPGQTGTFEMRLISGLKSGLINFEVTPFFNGNKKTLQYLNLPVYIKQPKITYEFLRSFFPSEKLQKNQPFEGWIELKNTGDVTWKKDGPYPIRIGTENPKDRPSVLSAGNLNRLGFLEQDEVKPGEIGKFIFKLTAPPNGGTYTEEITPLMESLTWLENKKLSFTIRVQGDLYRAKFVDASPETSFYPGQTRDVWIRLKNLGDVIWPAKGQGSLRAKFLKNKEIKIQKFRIDKDVKPGETAVLRFKLTAPAKPGAYKVFLTPSVDRKRLVTKGLYFGFEVSAEGKDSASTEASEDLKAQGGLFRLKLSFQGNPLISADGDFRLISDDQEIEKLSSDDRVEVSYVSPKYMVKYRDRALSLNSFPRFEPLDGSILEIKNWDRKLAWNSEINENRFRGALEVREVDGTLETINELSLENYLKGIAEEPNSEPFEKHKTIIVVARSYARYYQQTGEKFPAKPYHGSDDPAIFQKYRGYSSEIRSPNVVKAVNETSGEVVTYQSKPVKTPYFSQSDGRTRSHKEVWGTDVAYLQSVPDPYCEGLTLWGHGVGLSGCGARAAAENGKTYIEIIKYYYQGVEVEKIY